MRPKAHCQSFNQQKWYSHLSGNEDLPEERHNFGSRVSATIRKQLSTKGFHALGTLGLWGKGRMWDDHHNDGTNMNNQGSLVTAVHSCTAFLWRENTKSY